MSVSVRRSFLIQLCLRAGIGTFLALCGWFSIDRGPIEWKSPATVVSNGNPASLDHEPFLLFLQSMRRRLPAGATVVVLSPESAREPPDGISYLLAVGQLPEQVVLPWTVLRDPGAQPPQYVATFLRAMNDGRYRIVDQSSPRYRFYELARP